MTIKQRMIDIQESKNRFMKSQRFFLYNSEGFDASPLLRCGRKNLTQPCSLRKPMVDASSSPKRSISSKVVVKLRLARAEAVTS